MNCDHKPDWNAYALGEFTAPERREAEAHLATCEACRDELATLRLTLDTLSTLREEEVPRRIAFVSDKVFEPHWWQTLWNPAFAAACVLAAAILVHGFTRPATLPQAQIDAAVNKAVAHVQDRLVDLDYKSQQLTQAYMINTGLVRQ
jgi:anti-sigma factor RsiW